MVVEYGLNEAVVGGNYRVDRSRVEVPESSRTRDPSAVRRPVSLNSIVRVHRLEKRNLKMVEPFIFRNINVIVFCSNYYL